MKGKLLFAICVLGVVAQAASASGLPGALVTPQWLSRHLNEVTVVDIRDDMKNLTQEPQFGGVAASGKKSLLQTGGHIANAIAVDFNKIRVDRIVDGVKIQAQMPTAQRFTKIMDDSGLNKSDKPIVIVSVGDSVSSVDMATRLYFQLRFFGEPRDKIAILNGGLNAWLQDGYPVSVDKIAAATGNWTAGPADQKILASLEQVKVGLREGSYQFVDARPVDQFLGVVRSPVDKTPGHLAGAVSFPTDAIVRPIGAAYEFMSARDYKMILAQFHIRPDVPTISYCNTALFASGAWFVMSEIVGNPNSKLYAGSMIEWTNLGNPTVGLPD
ncbi:sulfurtransferase [Thiomonas sp. FB-Cd]|uniref:sulfurtransferase n=1 Tax=Thiomonas sp. FB-Cd TaxID=1158292 RepID=UPI0004DF09F7|nr:rhodanese-like domain-containing protein [Thiomonas sp. FB-Cd]